MGGGVATAALNQPSFPIPSHLKALPSWGLPVDRRCSLFRTVGGFLGRRHFFGNRNPMNLHRTTSSAHSLIPKCKQQHSACENLLPPWHSEVGCAAPLTLLWIKLYFNQSHYGRGMSPGENCGASPSVSQLAHPDRDDSLSRGVT